MYGCLKTETEIRRVREAYVLFLLWAHRLFSKQNGDKYIIFKDTFGLFVMTTGLEYTVFEACFYVHLQTLRKGWWRFLPITETELNCSQDHFSSQSALKSPLVTEVMREKVVGSDTTLAMPVVW